MDPLPGAGNAEATVIPSDDPTEKPSLILPAARFVGDQVYPERTFKLLEDKPGYNHKHNLASKTSSVGAAITRYVPNHDFDQWLDYFMGTLDLPHHNSSIIDSLEVYLPAQLNMWDRVDAPEPGKILYATTDKILLKLRELYDDLYVQEMPSSTKIADLRFLLSISESLDQAPQHPDIVLVPALYQAAHLPFLNNLQTELFFFYFTGKITEEQWNNAEAVMEGPFEQFNGFLLLAPFLALTLMAYNEISKDAVSNPRHTQTMTEDALAWAGMTFIKSKLLMTRFSDTETAICPARQHIHHAIRSGLFIKLYRSIIANKDQPTIKKLLTIAQDSAHSAVHHQTYNYRRFKGGPSAKRYDGKENSILAMAERHEATQASQKRA